MQDKHVVHGDEFFHNAHQLVAGAFVVLDHQANFSAMDATFGVDVVIQHLGGIQRVNAVSHQGARQGGKKTNHDLVVAHPWRLGVEHGGHQAGGKSTDQAAKAL